MDIWGKNTIDPTIPFTPYQGLCGKVPSLGCFPLYSLTTLAISSKCDMLSKQQRKNPKAHPDTSCVPAYDANLAPSTWKNQFSNKVVKPLICQLLSSDWLLSHTVTPIYMRDDSCMRLKNSKCLACYMICMHGDQPHHKYIVVPSL